MNKDMQLVNLTEDMYKQKAVAVTLEMMKVLLNWPKKMVNKNTGIKEDCRLTTNEYKLLWMVLGEINWRKNDNSNVVTLSCANMATRLGWKIDTPERMKRAFYDLRELTINLKRKSSVITIKELGKDSNSFLCASLFGDIHGNLGEITIPINPIFMPYLQGFINVFKFRSFWQKDIDTMETYAGINLGLAIRTKADYTKRICHVDFTTKQLKSEIFGCEKNEYTSMYKGKRKFNRTLFEKKRLDVACEDINLHSQFVHILPQLDKDGNTKLYSKKYKGNRVDKYSFKVEIDLDLMNKENLYFWNDNENKKDVLDDNTECLMIEKLKSQEIFSNKTEGDFIPDMEDADEEEY